MRLCVSLAYSKIKNAVMNFKISTKITLFYFILFIFTLLVSVFLYQRMHVRVMSDRIEEVSVQTLYSINSNIQSTLDNVNNYSRMIVANSDVRHVMKNGSLSRLETIKRMDEFLKRLIEETPSISSVYIIDNFRNKRGADKRSEMWLKINDIRRAPWYYKVLEKNGAYILTLNGGGIFDNTPDYNFVSLVRLLRDIDDLEPIGIMIVNIPYKAFEDLFNEILDKPGAEYVLLDDNYQTVVSNKYEKFDIAGIISKSTGKEYDSRIVKIDNKEYLQSYINMERHNWKFISTTPFEQMSSESEAFSLIAFFIILVNGLILFTGSVIISGMVTVPIKKMIKAMKGIEKREFRLVSVKTGNDEIGKLKDCYNMMVTEIQNLLHQTMEEQRIKRKAELNVLQAQVKPHFLYNTLDALSYLALSGKNEELYDSLEALGSYYRTSLSKGKEVVTIKEEIEIVRSYLTLQKLRYGDIFDVIYDIDERAYEFETLKLIMQPLVENALYHGIKPKGEMGIIKIFVALEDKNIVISIEDDGVGMSEEELLDLNSDTLDSNSESFGLKGTIKRLQIFYSSSDIYKIESKKRYGTKITLTVPAKRGVIYE
ncbi:MAG: sensor histidine kinase [Clostridiaceae bacterium]|nr:sensor histidine kinase [Clostridiaceae bacterium]